MCGYGENTSNAGRGVGSGLGQAHMHKFSNLKLVEGNLPIDAAWINRNWSRIDAQVKLRECSCSALQYSRLRDIISELKM